MKVLIVTPSYKPSYVYGGPTMSVSKLAESIYKLGSFVSVFTTTANGKEELIVTPGVQLELDGVKVIYFSRLTKDHSHFSPALLWNVFFSCRKFDVVHIQSWWNMVSMLSLLICWIRGVRPILSPRGMLSDFSFGHKNSFVKLFFHRTVGKFLLSKAILHATSDMESLDCVKIIPDWEYFILPNFVDLPLLNSSSTDRHRNDSFTLGFLSRIDKKKGVELMMSGVAKSKLQVRLLIAGTGEESYINELKSLSKQLNVENMIEWVGWKSNSDKFIFLSCLDLFVLTSYNENFANVVIEALSVGTPVLLSNQVGLSDFIIEEKLGWVTELSDESIAKVINLAYLDKACRTEIELIAPQRVRGFFTGETLAKRYARCYNKYRN